MDTKLSESTLVQISESNEGEQQIIKLTPGGHIIQIDAVKLANTVGLDACRLLEAINKLNEPSVQLASGGEEVVNIESEVGGTSYCEEDPQKDSVGVGGGNQHVVIIQGEEGEKEIYDFNVERRKYNIGEEEKPMQIVTAEQQSILRFSSYGGFKRALSEYESQTITKFILRNQSKQFTVPVCLHDILRNEKNSSELPMIRWEFCAAKDFLPIPFMGIPYITVGKQVFQCHQGKDYNMNKKQQYELRKEILNQATRFQIKSRNKGPSKKMDCPVLFAVRKMYFFPEYPLGSDSKRNRALVAQRLRHALFRIKNEKCECKCSENDIGTSSVSVPVAISNEKGSSDIIGKLEYLTRFPQNNEHNHDVAKAANFMKLQLKKHGAKGIEMSQHAKQQIKEAPFQYDKHIELIAALRAARDFDQLRTARENMAHVYPLTEELWLEWLHDEISFGVTPEQKQYVISTFDSAVKEYVSVNIWHEYCQYMVNSINSPTDIEQVRIVFEQAVTEVGAHVTDGSSIWDRYREFEMSILSSYQQLQNSCDGSYQQLQNSCDGSYQQLQNSCDVLGIEPKVQSQVERIATIYMRQLAIPLFGLDCTFKSFEDWYSGPIPDEARRLYESATEKLVQLMGFEEKLHTAEGNKLQEYLQYVEYEVRGGDSGRIRSIFERAIKDNSLNYSLWEKYVNYMDFELKIPNLAIQVHERSTKNCPWISKLWVSYLKALERNSVDPEMYLNIFNKSLKGGFAGGESCLQLWVTRCDYHRRQINDWNTERDKVDELQKSFESAVTYMSHYFGLEGDKHCLLLREWAFVEAKFLQNLRRAQELWDTVMKKHGGDHTMWLEYVNFLMLFGDVLSVRQVFQRAIQINTDKPLTLCEAFVKFERHHGTLSDIDDAEQKVLAQMKKAEERHEKDLVKEHSSSIVVSSSMSSSIVVGDNQSKHKFEKLKEVHGKKKKKKFEKVINSSAGDIETNPGPEIKNEYTDHEPQNLICTEDSNFALLTVPSLVQPTDLQMLKVNTTLAMSNAMSNTNSSVFDGAQCVIIAPLIPISNEVESLEDASANDPSQLLTHTSTNDPPQLLDDILIEEVKKEMGLCKGALSECRTQNLDNG